MRKLRQLACELGQGVLEVAVAIGVLTAILAVATPAYLTFQGQRASRRAEANLAAAAKAAESYRWSHGSYRGMTNIDLVREGRDVSSTITVLWARRSRYCVTETVHGKTWSLAGTANREPKLKAKETCA